MNTAPITDKPANEITTIQKINNARPINPNDPYAVDKASVI